MSRICNKAQNYTFKEACGHTYSLPAAIMFSEIEHNIPHTTPIKKITSFKSILLLCKINIHNIYCTQLKLSALCTTTTTTGRQDNMVNLWDIG
jgi:hypothetical protein